ncbi:MAG: hypothetical protein PUC88_02560 [Clostridia bacterium]|nr:hypothetical protein [Clostridia bacterium]
MKREIVRNIVNKNESLRQKLFYEGFIFTDKKVDETAYPFYGMWKNYYYKDYTLLVSPRQRFYVKEAESATMIMIGHAYNPFSMEHREEVMLDNLLQEYIKNDGSFYDELNRLTGVFSLLIIEKDGVHIIGDATCMQTTFYGCIDNMIAISSHTNLIGDIFSLEWDPFVKELVNYKFFHLFGNSLPGDITQFSQIKRVVPNYEYVISNNSISYKRFYYPVYHNITVEDIVKSTADLMCRNMSLIHKKWDKPAISLTGGCDSKTTLACTKDVFDKYTYFSYISSESEKVDADAAHIICDELGLEHTIYNISESDEDFSMMEEAKTILEWNTGDIVPYKRSEVRKRRFFDDISDFDVEIKSWASEIGRAYYSKRFSNRKNFGKNPTPRKCSTLYKVFLHNRKLLKKVDAIFEDYLNKFFSQPEQNAVPWQEQFFWEFRMSSWNGIVITGEHRYSFDITIPYNNRKILELLLSASIDDRISDKVYSELRQALYPKIDGTGIAITNLKHTSLRAKLENLYYILNKLL